jgi:hypothetical protein
MPEHRAKSSSKKDVQKAVSQNISEMAHGAHHGERVKKHGTKKARKMEIAASYRIARGKKSKHKASRR